MLRVLLSDSFARPEPPARLTSSWLLSACTRRNITNRAEGPVALRRSSAAACGPRSCSRRPGRSRRRVPYRPAFGSGPTLSPPTTLAPKQPDRAFAGVESVALCSERTELHGSKPDELPSWGLREAPGSRRGAERGEPPGHHIAGDRGLVARLRSRPGPAMRAETAHGEHEKRTGERDVNWPDWYAAYMVAEQAGAELPS